MENKNEWLFPASIAEAKEVQSTMARLVVEERPAIEIKLIGGMDVSDNRFDPTRMIYATCVTLERETLSLKDEAFWKCRQDFPYIPGLLGFREAPALIAAFERLEKKPDLILVDGHGLSHPRGLGIASHIGVLLDIPTIGVAKSILIGKPESELGAAVGSETPLVWKGKQVATLLRSKKNCLPLIISVGHRVTLDFALNIVKETLKGYRLPEPTRQAHLSANCFRRTH